jgi:type I restriction-modification system DNA methylase subunit
MVYFCAAALAQPCQWVQSREDEYLRRINRYPKDLHDHFPSMLAEIVMAFEQEGFADILGEMYMQLDFGNQSKGQFFTPYHVCRFMAKVSAEDPSDEIKKNGFISVNDPCCGSGALLVAFAENCVDNKINYQQNVLFVGQDIDPVVARMAFIQLALLGCAGYVIIGNSLTNPTVGDVLFPKTGKVNENVPDAEIWYTPMFFHDTWSYRRTFRKVTALTKLFEGEKNHVNDSENQETEESALCVLKSKG